MTTAAISIIRQIIPSTRQITPSVETILEEKLSPPFPPWSDLAFALHLLFLNNFFGGKRVVYVTTVLFTGVFSLYATITSTFKLAVPAVDNLLSKVKFLPVPADFAWLNFALVGFVLGVVLTFFVKENK